MTELPKKAIDGITCQTRQHTLWTLQFSGWFPILLAHHRSKKLIPIPRHILPPFQFYILTNFLSKPRHMLVSHQTSLAWTAHMAHPGHWIEEYSHNPWRNQIYIRTTWIGSFIFHIPIPHFFPSYFCHMLVTILISFMTHLPLVLFPCLSFPFTYKVL
jgi:hypothetical protein